MAYAYTPVPAPPAGPSRVGLVTSAVEPADTTQGRWVNGFAFTPEHCTGGGTIAWCSSDDPTSLPVEGNEGVVQVHPVVIWHGDECSSFGFGDQDFQARARRALNSRRSYLLEAELWSGAKAQAAGYPNNWLTNSASANFDDVTPVDGAQPLLHALAILQDALTDAVTGRAMIHATRQVVSLLYAEGAVTREGNVLVDAFGNIVVPGEGYPGTGPDDASPADGQSWMYGTSLVEVRLGPERLVPDPDRPEQATNRDDNLVEWRIEQPAAVYWDGCGHLAINVDFCNTCCSTTGS